GEFSCSFVDFAAGGTSCTGDSVFWSPGRIMCAGFIFKSFSEAAQKTVSLLPGRRIRKPSISESGRCSGKWDSDTGSRTDMDRLKQVRDATVAPTIFLPLR